jgi:aminopeptidase N
MSEHAHLTQTQASNRFALFAEDPKIHYDIYMQLPKGAAHYWAQVNITFSLKDATSELFLDLNCRKRVEAIVINGTKVQSSNNYADLIKQVHLFLPNQYLKLGENLVTIVFTNEYSKGKGIYKFTDTDDLEFIYSLSEPYHANKIIPCFDQPDLKAKFKLTMILDKSWVGVYNERLLTSKSEIPESIKEHFTVLG